MYKWGGWTICGGVLFVLFVNEIVEFVDGEVVEVVEPMGTGFRTAKVKKQEKTKIMHALKKKSVTKNMSNVD